jgi:two-component system nitrate/nitrite response regulator NarL
MIRVLIVDDEDDVRLLLRLQLEAAGFEVVGASPDGRSAVEVCAAANPDAVVLDLLMPRMSGFEAIPRLREVHPEVVIVAYTATAGDFVRAEMARLEVALVLKSGDIRTLAATIEAGVQAVRAAR